MGSNYLQSRIISQLIFFLMSKLGSEFEVLTNELGVQIDKKSWRAADIAIIRKDLAKQIENPNEYLSFAPELVIEIDTKAEFQEMPEPYNYFMKKTDQLLEFGVKQVVWIFTESKKIMLADAQRPWQTFSWDDEVPLFEGISLHLPSLLE